MNELSGYKELKVGEKIFSLKFGTNATALFCIARGVDLNEIASTGIYGKWEGDKMISPPDVYAILQLAWFAHVTACKIKGEETSVGSMEEFIEYINEYEGVLDKIVEAMQTSKFLGKKITGEEVKKKQN
ncbi:MAG TPA: hypothetical protein PLA73_01245 [Sedimentibacter sp.]|nr:hypothetical protein [Sedimentibacter sp.]